MPSSEEGTLDEALFGEADVPRHERSPADVLRIVGFATLTTGLICMVLWAERAVSGFESDIVDLFGSISPGVERILNGFAQIVVIAIAAVFVAAALWGRRWRLLGYLVVGNAVSGLVAGTIHWWLGRHISAPVANELAQRAGVSGGLVDVVVLAQLMASLVILGPFVTRRWRKAGHLVAPMFGPVGVAGQPRFSR